MKWKHRLHGWAFFLLPTILLAVACGVYLYRLAGYLSVRMAPLVAQVLAESVHRQVRIGNVAAFHTLGHVTVDDVVISNGPTFSASGTLPAITVKEISISYSLAFFLAHPTNAVGAISNVRLLSPTAYIERLPSGKYNFSDLLAIKPSAKPSSFLGVVTVTDGAGVLKDDDAPTEALKLPVRLTNIAARLDLTSENAISFSAVATGDPMVIRSIRLHGETVRNDTSQKAKDDRAVNAGYGLDIVFAGANLGRFSRYLIPRRGLDVVVSAGTGQGEVAIRQVGRGKARQQISGSITVAGADVILPGSKVLSVPVRAITGTAQFTQRDAAFNVTAEVNRQKVLLNGTVLTFNRPLVYVEADSNRLVYAALRQSLPSLPAVPQQIALSSPLMVHSWISGRLSNPTIDASIDEPELTAAGYPLRHLHADLTYSGRVLNVNSAEVDNLYGDGIVSGSGYVDTTVSPPRFHLYGQARSVEVTRLPLPAAVRRSLQPMSASVSAVFDATNQGIHANVASSRGTIIGIRYLASEADIQWQPGQPIDIYKLFIRLPGSGIVVASGKVPVSSNDPDLHFQFHAAQVDLGQIPQRALSSSVHGLAYARGIVTGELQSPIVSTHVFILQPQYGRYKADVLTTDLAATTRSVKVNKLTIRFVPGTAEATGMIDNPLGKDPRLDLKAEIRDIPISYIASALNSPSPSSASKMPLAGFVNGSAQIAGTINDPHASAALTLENGTFDELQLSKAATNVTYHSGIVDIQSVRASVASVDIVGTGTYNAASSKISLDVNATANDLAQVTEKYVPGIQIYGGLGVAASITGQFSSPEITATVAAKDVSIEGAKLSVSPSTFKLNQNRLTMVNGPLAIACGDARYSLAALDVDFSNRTIESSGSESGETLTHLLSVFRASPYLSQHYGGSLNDALARMPVQPTGNLQLPNFSVVGALAHPTVSVTADLTSANLAGQAIDHLHAQLSVQRSAVTLSAFQLTGPNNAFLQASGEFDPTGPVDAQLEASGFNLSLLDPYLPRHGAAEGTLGDLSVVATGMARAPEITASITIDKPAYNGFSLDRIDTGEVDLKGGVLSVSELTFTKEEKTANGSIVDHTLDVAGTVPLVWKSSGFLQADFPSNLPISLKAKIPAQSLSFVRQMVPSLPVEFSSGSIAANLDISGTLADKEVNGEFALTDASVAATGYQTSLSHLNVDLVLAGKQFNFRNFSADSNFGGSIGITGGGTFNSAALLDTSTPSNTWLNDVQLTLSAKASNFVVDERKIAIFNNAGATARINDSLTVNGPVLRPVMSGSLSIDKIVGSLPQTAASPNTSSAVPVFNPRFNITVNIKPEAQIKTPQLNALADGSVVLAGSLYRPRVDGTFLIRKGQFYFPTATFKVVPVGTVEFHYRPPGDVIETVEMTAVTSISVSPDIIARNPAGANTTQAYLPTVVSTAATSPTRYTVTVNIDGDLEEPDHLHLTFESNPPGLTDAQILAVLGGQEAIAGLAGGNIVSALQNQVASVFNASVVPKILQPFEDSIGTVFGLEDLSIDYAPESPVQVTLVKRLGSRLSVQYIQSVNSRTPGAVSSTLEPPVYQVKLGYSFTPRLQVTISSDDQHNEILAIEGVQNF